MSARPRTTAIDWYDPAAAGDILQLSGRDYDRVCLIDGFFDDRPAPWHKEIMVLMAEGVEVFGASSMGALRAAELDRHGMVGFGRIYQAFRSGLLSGDDEVALIHAPRSLGWAPLSVPLVELRATLCLLVRRRTLDGVTARRVLRVASEIFYADRDWPEMVRQCVETGIDKAIMSMIEQAHVPLKFQDAVECVDAAGSLPRRPGSVRPVPETSFLKALRAEVELRPPMTPAG